MHRRICQCGNEVVTKYKSKSERCRECCNASVPFFVYQRFKWSSKSRGKEFSIKLIDVIRQYRKQNKRCYYTNSVLDKATISIDRIDSSVGYHVENIALCTKQVNIAKNVFTERQFRLMCKQVAHNKVIPK